MSTVDAPSGTGRAFRPDFARDTVDFAPTRLGALAAVTVHARGIARFPALDLGLSRHILHIRGSRGRAGLARGGVGELKIGVEPGDLGRAAVGGRIRKTVGKPTKTLVHVANQQNCAY